MTEIMLRAGGVGLLALLLGAAWATVIVNRSYTRTDEFAILAASLLFITGFCVLVVCGTVGLLMHAWGYW